MDKMQRLLRVSDPHDAVKTGLAAEADLHALVLALAEVSGQHHTGGHFIAEEALRYALGDTRRPSGRVQLPGIEARLLILKVLLGFL
jgi:hypothetical protein